MTIPTNSVTEFDELAAQIKQLESAIQQLMIRASEAKLKDSGTLTNLLNKVLQEFKTAKERAQQLAIRREQMQQLVHTSALLTSSLELDSVLEEVMDTVIKLIKAERAYLMLRDAQSGELTIRAARSWEHENIQSEEISFSRGLANKAIEDRAPILTTNDRMTEYTGLVNTIGLTMRSVACIPLTLRDEVIGVLYADKKLKYGIFTPDSLPMIAAFANQAAIAIENARLFGQVKAELVETQKEARQIFIQIDEGKTSKHLEEVINTDFFKKLLDAANSDQEDSGG